VAILQYQRMRTEKRCMTYEYVCSPKVQTQNNNKIKKVTPKTKKLTNSNIIK